MKFTLNITSFDLKQCLVAINVNQHRYYSTNNNHNQNNNIETTIPIVSYLNPYQNRHEIYKDNKNKPGIYRWVNLIDNKSQKNASGKP